LVFALLGVATAFAQEGDYPIRKGIELPPVVVTPTRGEQTILETQRSVNAIDEERRTELGARSIPDMLEGQTGVQVQRTNRGSGAPIIRGLIGPQNLIVVDGVRLNTSTFRTGPNQYLALIDPNAVYRVEVVRGPSSVLYGNGAMGGVMRMFTVDPVVGLGHGATVSGRVASADISGGGSARYEGSAGDFGWVLGGTYDHFGTLRAGGGEDVPVSEYDAAYWQAKLRWEPSPTWSLNAAYLGMLMRDAGRTDKLGRGEVRLYDNDDHLAYLRLNWTGYGVVKSLRTAFSFHRLDELVERANCATNDDKTVVDRARCAALDAAVIEKRRRNDDRADVLGGDFELGLGFLDDRLRLITGADLYLDDVGSTREDAKADDGFVFTPKARGNFSDGSTYLSVGTYLHADAVVARMKDVFDVRLNGGARFSHFSANAPDVPGVGEVDYGFNGLVGSGGVQFVVPDKLNVYASFVQGFRAPNLQETTVLGNTGSKFEVPNADLKPERSNTIETGAKARLGAFQVSAVYFYSMLEDAIDEEPATHEGAAEVDGTPVVRRVNTAEGLYQGVEGGISVDWWRFTAAAGVAWIQGELTDGDGVTTDARRVPPLSGTASIRYTHPDRRAYGEVGVRWAARQDALHPSDLKDLRICETARYSGLLKDNCDGTPGYAALTLRGGWRFHPMVRADLSISNLLDSEYRVHGSGFAAPGIDARLSLTAVF